MTFGDFCCGLLLMFVLASLAVSFDHAETSKAQEWAEKHPKRSLGALSDAVHSESTETTTIILVDGTRIRVQGAYPVIKPGMGVNTPAATYDGPKFYCLGSRCLPEADAN